MPIFQIEIWWKLYLQNKVLFCKTTYSLFFVCFHIKAFNQSFWCIRIQNVWTSEWKACQGLAKRWLNLDVTSWEKSFFFILESEMVMFLIYWCAQTLRPTFELCASDFKLSFTMAVIIKTRPVFSSSSSQMCSLYEIRVFQDQAYLNVLFISACWCT